MGTQYDSKDEKSDTTTNTVHRNTQIIKNLEFTIPDGWWISSGEEGPDGRVTYLIHPHPISIFGPSDSPSGYILDFSPSFTFEQQKTNIIDGIPFAQVEEEEILIGNNTGVKLSGTVNYGRLADKKPTVLLINAKEGVYYLQDNSGVNNHSAYFDQIIKSMTFKN